MKRTTNCILAAGLAVFLSTTAYAQQTPPPTQPPARLPTPAEMGAGRADMMRGNRLAVDYDRERNEVNKRDPRPRSADGRQLRLSRQERESVADIERALRAEDYAQAGADITEALGRAHTADAKYTFAAMQLRLGYATNDGALQDQAVAAALDTGIAPEELLPGLYRHHGVAALKAGNYPEAEAAFTELVALNPDDAEATVLLAESKNRVKKPDEALPLFQKAIELKRAANLPIPPAWSNAVAVTTAMVNAQGASQQ